MKKTTLIILIIILLVSVIGAVSIKYYANYSISYQLYKLKNGSSKEKIMVAEFMGRNKVKEAIPLLISYLDSNEWFLDKGKSSPTLTCVSTRSLEKIAENKFGNTCNEDNSKGNFQIYNIKKTWAQWYWNQQDHKMLTYHNDKLGFEIKYPEKVLSLRSNCHYDALVPVKFFEDLDNDAVYLSTEYVYQKNTNNVSCEKIYNTLDLQRSLKDWEDELFPRWRIVVKNIYNDNELDRFINDFYGQKCHLGEKTPTPQAGVYDIATKYDGKELGESDCFLNFMGEFKYYPKKNKAITWNIGQDWVFWGDTDYDISYDEEMADSFRFLE